MKLKIFDIPEEGLDFDFNASKEAWLENLFRSVYEEDYPKTAEPQGHLNLNIIKTCQNISLVGDVEVNLEATCDRCLEKFSKKSKTPLNLTLLPYSSMSFNDEGTQEDSGTDDENISYYKTDEIDLDEILKENLYLNMPLRDLCQESCKGLCPQCGQNLNLAVCDCREKSPDPRLAILKDFAVKQKKAPR